MIYRENPSRRQGRVAGALALLVVATLGTRSVGATDFANFESTAVHPLRLSVDGRKLYAVHTPGHALAIYDLADPAAPVLEQVIPVGLEPVSVTPRTATEVWVANLLSDSVSVVDTQIGAVVATLRVVDEPSDVAFAGGKAFVSAAVRDEIHVFDATTRQPLGVIPVFGEEPRALATSPDGTEVYVLSHRSGNGTTILHHTEAPPPPPPSNPLLPPAPQSGLIVRADDPVWDPSIPYTLPDQDIFVIDAAAQAVVDTFSAVGTINFDLVVDPTTGELFVSNTEARNLVRFLPNLRGHIVDNRISRITPNGPPLINAFDLNPSVDYGLLPNPAALGTAISDPTGLALDAGGGLLYVAAQGTDRIAVFDLASSSVVDRIEVGGTPGALVDSPSKRGPRGLALHPSGDWLYVWSRLSDTIVVVDASSRTVADELPIGSHDPVPADLRTGRKFLYDAKLSGNGTVSCASCHVDGDGDQLAWDLGDPAGVMEPVPPASFFDPPPYPDFHPMKGPMFTQTLRGLVGVGPLHWRGDRADFAAFNPAFDALMGGTPLSADDLDLFVAWSETVLYPPNPNQLLDRTLRSAPATASEQRGLEVFDDMSVPGPCGSCHPTDGAGTLGLIRKLPVGETMQMKIAHLRNLYRKDRLNRALAAPQKSGFGSVHDGSNGGIGSLQSFVGAGLFLQGRIGEVAHVMAFLRSWDTGTAPTVGYQAQLDQSTASSPELADDLTLLERRAAAGDIDLVVRGAIAGEPRAYLYDPATNLYVPDRADLLHTTSASLVGQAQGGTVRLVFTGAYPGTGAGIARSTAGAQVALVGTTKLRLADDDVPPIDPEKRSFHFKSTASGVLVPHVGSLGDPTIHGARLSVYRVGGGPAEEVQIDIPAVGWQRAGDLVTRRYRYTDAQGLAGPIRRIDLRAGKLRITGKGGALYSLANAPQGEIAVKLALGEGLEICASAPASRHDSTARFNAQARSPAPPACPSAT